MGTKMGRTAAALGAAVVAGTMVVACTGGDGTPNGGSADGTAEVTSPGGTAGAPEESETGPTVTVPPDAGDAGEPGETAEPAPTASVEPSPTQGAGETGSPSEPAEDEPIDPGTLPGYETGFTPSIEFEGTPAGFTANEEVLAEDWAPQWIGENGCEYQAMPFDYETVEDLGGTSSVEASVERLQGLLAFHGDEGGRGFGLATFPGDDGATSVPFVTTGGASPDGTLLMVATTASHAPLEGADGFRAWGFDVTYRCPAEVEDMQTGWNAISETARVTMAYNEELPEQDWPLPGGVD